MTTITSDYVILSVSEESRELARPLTLKIVILGHPEVREEVWRGGLGGTSSIYGDIRTATQFG